jgi:hypothetical protein
MGFIYEEKHEDSYPFVVVTALGRGISFVDAPHATDLSG